MHLWATKALAVVGTAALLCGSIATGAAAKENETPEIFSGLLELDTSLYEEKAFRTAMEKEKKDQLTLVENGKTAFTIVYPANAGSELKKAVAFLQSTLKTMTGADFKAEPASDALHEKEIVLGNARGGARPTEQTAGKDGFQVSITSDRLHLNGASALGDIYSIYTFLEDSLGCVFLSDSETYIPALPTIHLAPKTETQKPAMAWRNYFSYEVTQNDWFERLRLNGIGYQKDGKLNQYDQWGTWCHSYFTYVNPDDYFDAHPEYFSMKDGKRIREYKGQEAQLCLTNPEVLEIVKTEMRKRMEKNPELLYWDFSVMDSSNIKGCECENCKKLDDAAGSGMGSLLPFINALAKEFPDKYISTLAYFHTIHAPKNLVAEKNVVIKLCSMPGSQASPYAEGGTPNSRQFKEFLEEWTAVSCNLVVWDYVVNFQNLLLPFPNYAVQQKNQKFYEDNGVTGVFHQASREQGDEMADLRAYLLSRLLWEGSSMDVNAQISKYLCAAYGKAAPKMAEYLHLSALYLQSSRADLGLYDNIDAHKDGYLSAAAIAKYQTLFSEALAQVEGDAVLTKRIREAEIPVLYAKMLEFSKDKEGRAAAAQEFFRRCDEFGITQIREVKCSVEDFKNGQYQSLLRYRTWQKVKVPVIVGSSVLGVLVLAGITLAFYKRHQRKKHNK